MSDPTPTNTVTVFLTNPEWRRQQAKKTAASVPELRLKAEAGDTDAQHELGWAYMGRDIVEAAKWLELAAEGGRVHAMSAVSMLYEYGRGVTIDAAKAYRWALIRERFLSAETDDVDDRTHNQETLSRLAKKLPPDRCREIENQAAEWHQSLR